MHCAFAKYEEGFKRIPRTKANQKREEIERGVAKELEKRKIESLAADAAANATDSEDENEYEGNMDERRFMQTM